MADVMDLQEGEEPRDAGNFVLVEQIAAPRGARRYRVVAQGVNDDGPGGIQKTVDSLELAREWAEAIAHEWRSHPPIHNSGPKVGRRGRNDHEMRRCGRRMERSGLPGCIGEGILRPQMRGGAVHLGKFAIWEISV